MSLFKKTFAAHLRQPLGIGQNVGLTDFGSPYALMIPPLTKGSAEDNGGVIVRNLLEVFTPPEGGGSSYALWPLGAHADGRVMCIEGGQIGIIRAGFTGAATNHVVVQVWAQRPNARATKGFDGALWERAKSDYETVQLDATDDYARLTVDDGTGVDRSVAVEIDNSSGVKYYMSQPWYFPLYGRDRFVVTIQDDAGLTAAKKVIILAAACSG